jgi:hypothetical protein
MGDATAFNQAAQRCTAGPPFNNLSRQQQAETCIIIDDLVGRIGHIRIDRIVLGGFPPPIAANENYIRQIMAYARAS